MTEEEKRAQRCCIICGRPACLRQYKRRTLISALSRSIRDAIDSGIHTFIIPYRDGYEAISANTIINVKKKYKGIHLIVAKPKAQAQTSMSNRETFLLQVCDFAANVGNGIEYYPDAMLDRWMVDHSCRIIVFRGDDFNEDINTLITYAEERGLFIDDFVKYDMLRRSWKKRRSEAETAD